MLYESTYNQYFLEHSWGDWKNHLYISKEKKDGKWVYHYPQSYYDQYKQELMTRAAKNRNRNAYNKYANLSNEDIDNSKSQSRYFNLYAERRAGEATGVEKIINNSVKAAVNVLNFGADMKDKATDYLNRFGNAVANAWNNTKSKISSFAGKGKSFLKGAGYLASKASEVIAPRVSASVKNLIKGAGEAISKGWNSAKDTVSNLMGKKKTSQNSIPSDAKKNKKKNGPTNYAPSTYA